VASEHEFSAVSCRDVGVDNLDRGELLERAARSEPRRQGMQTPPEGDVQAVGQESDEDVRLDACLFSMEDRPDGEIALEALEGFLHGDQLEIVAP
jgi:hypothetical protein